MRFSLRNKPTLPMRQIINFWFQLLQESNAALAHSGEPEKSCHFFNSFFYTKVSEDGYNYRNVRRWTRKVSYLSSINIVC